MPVITTSRLKKLLCQTLIREKLSYKIIFQNTTFPFSPLKLKNNFMKKIKFKKLLSVFKTDKIANLHGHEVLRTPVRHCELNPIELIWAQVKARVCCRKQYNFSFEGCERTCLWGVWQNYKGSLGEGRRPCIKNRKGVWERELH